MKSLPSFRYLRDLLLLACTCFLMACGGSGSGSGGGVSGGAVVPPSPPSVAETPACLPDATANYLTPNYYVGGAGASDGNDGTTTSKAWATLTRALAEPGPAVIHFLPGSYGILNETAVPALRTGYLTLRPAPSAAAGSVVLTGVNISYPGGSKTSAKLRIVGFTIKPDYDPTSNFFTYLKNVKDFELLNNVITTNQYSKATATPGAPAMFSGVSLDNTDGLLIKSNKITSVFIGLAIINSSNATLQCNYIKPETGSAIQYSTNNTSGLILDNHIRGGAGILYTVDAACLADPACLNAPDGPHAHSSIVSIRSNDLIIRNNIMHGMGTTSALRTYPYDGVNAYSGLAAYSNILIEGNLIYDVWNAAPVQMLNAASEIVFRNNLVVGFYFNYPASGCLDGVIKDARYRYNSAFQVKLASGYDGSGISIANNILVGAAQFPLTAFERNNIIWSYSNSPDNIPTWQATTASGTSNVITSASLGCGNHSTYFESSFFAAAPNFNFAHSQLLNLKPLLTSEAVNFGDASIELMRALGNLDASDEFVSTVVNRTVSGDRSAGPYVP